MTEQSLTYLETLNQAIAAIQSGTGDHPASTAMVAALLSAEKAAKQQRLTYALPTLMGKWQLCFTATRGAHQRSGQVQGRGWYWPSLVPAMISFQPVDTSDRPIDGTIENQIQLGPVCLQLKGLFKYPGKKNLLAFDFTQARLSVSGKTLYDREFRGGTTKAQHFAEQTVATLPFFAFFLVTEDYIAARGRGGGLALWRRR